MPPSRSILRNVHFQFEGDEKLFGGMTISEHANRITNSQLLRYLDILIRADIPDDKIIEEYSESVYQVFLGQDEIVANESFMRTGTYTIVPRHKDSVKLRLTSESLLRRALSHSTSGRESSFKKAVRERDEGCAISHEVNNHKKFGFWDGFEAAHVFPLERGSEFEAMEGSRWITDCESSKLNSPQNGMMLTSFAHKLFDQFLIGIDVDDGYKVVPFTNSTRAIESYGENTLAEWARENGDVGVRDALLRWHLRMCVLANMKAAGEPVWEYEDDHDIAGAVLSEDPSGEQFALEVSRRLAHREYDCIY